MNSTTKVSRRSSATLIFPIALCMAHFVFLLMVANAENDGWAWVVIVGLDFPVSMLAMLVSIGLDISPVVPFGILGTAWWFAIAWLIQKLLRKLFKYPPVQEAKPDPQKNE